MKRTYVPFHYNETDNITLFYDYEAEQFFTNLGARPNPLVVTFSGTAGIIIYALFQDMVINIGGHNPLFMVSFSLIISFMLAFGTIWGVQYVFKKNLDKIEIVDTPSKKEMAIYIQEGEKWLKSILLMIFFLFIFTLMALASLFLKPDNFILLASNTILWAALLILILVMRPLKRRTIYKQFKKEM